MRFRSAQRGGELAILGDLNTVVSRRHEGSVPLEYHHGSAVQALSARRPATPATADLDRWTMRLPWFWASDSPGAPTHACHACAGVRAGSVDG